MTRKKSFYIGMLALGACLLASGIILHFFGGEGLKAVTGTCFGIGAGLASMSIANLHMKRMEERNPEWGKQNAIEFSDERNTFIRFKAKAKVADFMQWCIMGIAYITIIVGTPLWVTAVIVGVFMLYNLLVMYYTGKYQKEI